MRMKTVLSSQTVCVRVCVCVCVFVQKNDIPRWATTQSWTDFSALLPPQQCAECEPLLENLPLNIIVIAQHSCVWVQAEQDHCTGLCSNYDKSNHKTRAKLLPIVRNSESRTVDLATRTRCVK